MLKARIMPVPFVHPAFAFRGECQTRLNVFRGKIREIIENFCVSHSGCQIRQNVYRR
jgi:hypothetical protein